MRGVEHYLRELFVVKGIESGKVVWGFGGNLLTGLLAPSSFYVGLPFILTNDSSMPGKPSLRQKVPLSDVTIKDFIYL